MPQHRRFGKSRLSALQSARVGYRVERRPDAQAYLKIQVNAPDFQVEDSDLRFVEVPLTEDSQQISFSLKANKKGECTIDVSVSHIDKFNTAKMQDLLEQAFSDEDLTSLCFGHFESVHNQFSTGMSAVDKRRRLVEYCEKHGKLQQLLSLVKKQNSHQYKRFQSQLYSSITKHTTVRLVVQVRCSRTHVQILAGVFLVVIIFIVVYIILFSGLFCCQNVDGSFNIGPTCTPTPTLTPTVTPSTTPSASPTPTETSTPIATLTPTASPIPTQTATATTNCRGVEMPTSFEILLANGKQEVKSVTGTISLVPSQYEGLVTLSGQPIFNVNPLPPHCVCHWALVVDRTLKRLPDGTPTECRFQVVEFDKTESVILQLDVNQDLLGYLIIKKTKGGTP